LNPIAQRFSAASGIYDEYARVQRQVADAFTGWIVETWKGETQPNVVLDLGCGTGYFSRGLQNAFPQARMMACDWAPEMLNIARKNADGIAFFQGDAANFVAPERANLIASNFCMQWLADIPSALEHHLRHCERLAVAMPCDGSFLEWRRAHEALGCDSGLHRLPNSSALRHIMQSWYDAGLVSNWRWEIRQFTELHADGLAFAHSLKAIGAATPRPGHRPVNLRKLFKHLPSPLTTNYEVLFLSLEPVSTAN